MSDINIKISVSSANATANLDKLNKSLATSAKATESLSLSISQTTSAFKVFAGNLAAVGVSKIASELTQLGSSILQLGVESVKAASDAEETLNKFNVVFQDVSTSANKAASEIAAGYGLAESKSKELLSATGDLLTGFGFSGESALELSTEVQKLAADLASFTNFSGGAEGASAALTKALLGERESVKSLGISILEEDVKKQVAINTAKGLTFATERQAKAQATLDLALAQSKNAIGDFERSSGSLANQQRILTAKIQDYKEALGKELLPTQVAVTKTVISYLERLKETGEAQTFLANLTKQIPDILRAVGDAFIFITEAISEARIFINNVRIAFNSLAAGAIDIVVALNNAEIAVKKFLNVDVSNLEKQNETLKLLKESLTEVAVDSIQANDTIKKSQQETTAFVTEQVNFLTDAYNKEAEAATNAASKTVEADNTKLNSKIQTAQTLAQFLAAAEGKSEETKLADEQALLELAGEEKIKFIEEQLGREEAIKLASDLRKLQSEQKLADASVLITQKSNEAKKKQADNQLKAEKTLQSGLISLSSSSNKELAAIGKGAAIYKATVDGIAAVQQVYKDIPYPFNIAAAAGLAVVTASNVSKIASTNPSFAQGGIVPGNSFSGDNVTANVNSGEMILNRQQQSELFNVANGQNGGGSKEIVVYTTVELDGEAVGKSVSRQVANGLQLGENI